MSPIRRRARRPVALRFAAALATALLAAAPPAAAQWEAFGQPCSGPASAPQIGFAGSTVPGQTAQLRLQGAPPGAWVLLAIGSSDSHSPAFGELPLDLSAFSGVQPGCQLLVSPDILLTLNADAQGALTLGFAVPTALGSDLYFQWIVFEALQPAVITASGGAQLSVITDPQLHALLLAPDVVVDWDGSGQAPVVLDGSTSHSHTRGVSVISHSWKVDGAAAGVGPLLVTQLAPGEHTVSLLVGDNAVPANSALALHTATVVGADAVPGVLARYHGSGAADPVQLLDAPPAFADHAQVLDSLHLDSSGGWIGNSPFTGQVMISLHAQVSLPQAGLWNVQAAGGSDRRLFLNGALVSGPLRLGTGPHALEARFAVPGDAAGWLPLTVAAAFQDGVPAPLPGSALQHDATGSAAVLHVITPGSAPAAGGTALALEGWGFFPAGEVVVHWGSTELTVADGLIIEPTQIRFPAPPHPPGALVVTVATPAGQSNTKTFNYQADGGGAVPSFMHHSVVRVPYPTSAAWGPDERLYVATLTGELAVLSFDDDWLLTDLVLHTGASQSEQPNILGLAFDPFEAGGPPRVIIGHGRLYADGGGAVLGPSTYHGRVSVLTGPDFDDPQPLVTGLPQSNSGHGVNGLDFDDNGDLLIAMGSNTNAGVAWITLGDLPESPLSAAVLRARLSAPDYQPHVAYVNSQSGLPDNDQRHGEQVVTAPGSHVEVLGAGLRNPYDLVYTQARRLYATDNGPNSGFGPASLGPDSEGPHPDQPDELLLIEAGAYYGSANRSRGQHDPRQNIWHGPTAPEIPGVFTQTLTTLPSSTDGICEYTSATFGGSLRGDLIAQTWLGAARRITLTPDGRGVASVAALLPETGALDILTGPGGALIAIDNSQSEVEILLPVEVNPPAFAALDIRPWRAPDTGGAPFVLAGRGFGTLAETVVLFADQPAILLSVSPTRIRGVVPPAPVDADSTLVDVTVHSGGNSDMLPAAFRWLTTPKGSEPDLW